MRQTERWNAKVERAGDDRVVVLPKDLVLEGEDIEIVQDDWGEITIHPTSPEGRKVLDKFGPFGDLSEEDFARMDTPENQAAFEDLLEKIRGNQRRGDQTLIVRDPEIMFGKPTIAGTRITVEAVLHRLAAGMSVQEVTKDFPHVSEHQVKAALEYAAEHLPSVRTPSRKAAE